ncbi:hypothetical protein GCM10027347_57530 [Larkinella harenae]
MQNSGTIQEYRVQILTNDQRVDVHFDGSGRFRDAHTAPGLGTTAHSVSYIPKDKLSDAIKTALSSTYASYTYGWAEEHIHDGTTTYDVKLFSNNQPIVLHFDTAGAQIAPMEPGGASAPAGSGPKAGFGGWTAIVSAAVLSVRGMVDGRSKNVRELPLKIEKVVTTVRRLDWAERS